MRVITGKARGVTLKTPEGLATRPTADRVKEALFSVINFDIPGADVLDLFGGTGQLGIEALSRGANTAVFVDESDHACALIKENLRRTKLESQGRVVRSFQLQTTTTNVAQFIAQKTNGNIGGNLGSRFIYFLFVNKHLPCHNCSLRSSSAFKQATVYEECV